MNSVKVLIPVLSAAALLGACTPFPEPWMHQSGAVPGPPPPANRTVSDADQQMIREQRLKAEENARRAEADRLARAQGTAPDNRPPGGSANTPNPGTSGATAGGDTVKPVEPKKEYPYATKVPGKDGFVLSPYNTKVIDVRDIPSGTLVQDPNYPASEKKYFRIP